jgi:hypothetical protein
MMSRQNSIGPEGAALEDIREQLEERSLNSIRRILPDATIHDICRELGYRFRRRILSPLVTVLHMFTTAIWREDSFQAAWQTQWSNMVGHLPGSAGQSPSSGSVAKARGRLPMKLFEKLFAWVAHEAQTLSSGLDTCLGHRVVLIDGTCVSMPDKPALTEAFGKHNTKHGPTRFPLARVVTLALANTFTIIDYRLSNIRQSESALMFELLTSLNPGDLLLGDRHFAAAHYYAAYKEHRVEFLTRAHQRLHVNKLKVIEQHAPNDRVVELPINPMYRRRDPSLPESITVRIIKTRLGIRGRFTWESLVTSLLDPAVYPAKDIAALYASRWGIETLIEEVKIGLGADVLRSEKPEGIRKEVAARLTAINIVRSIILEAAIRHDVDPLRISFRSTMRTVLAFASRLAARSVETLQLCYDAMLHEIAANLVPERPNRLEPRAVKRETKHYPALKIPRSQWRREALAES